MYSRSPVVPRKPLHRSGHREIHGIHYLSLLGLPSSETYFNSAPKPDGNALPQWSSMLSEYIMISSRYTLHNLSVYPDSTDAISTVWRSKDRVLLRVFTQRDLPKPIPQVDSPE
ncbi:hypothetical protein JTB14_037128 [Gonioctena quinquepunctata]|nr:hypothetical protein JTB14_037128 [Gonioctena quinquepunctata]